MTTTHDPSVDERPGEGPLPIASLDDPHLQPYARNPRRAELIVGATLLAGVAGFAAYGAVYWVGGQTQWEGLFLGVGLFAFGFGLSAWGKYLLPQGPFVEDRHDFEGTPQQQEAMTAAVFDRGGMVFRRRGFLGGILALGSLVMGVVLGFPLLRSLGPRPRGNNASVDDSYFTTNWAKDSFVVDINGTRLTKDTLEVGGYETVFPEGHTTDPTEQAVDQAFIIRLEPSGYVKPADPKKFPGRGTWAPDGIIAYSKVCTHVGCPVGLYEELATQLLCPCHQSIFEMANGGEPIFGPAPRPLPQLPLYIDNDGFLRAQSGFDQPIGPGFWERS